MHGCISRKTPASLQEAIAEDLRKLFSGKMYKNPDRRSKDEYLEIQVYEQNLPIPVNAENGDVDVNSGIDYAPEIEDDPVYNVPWCLVKLDSGGVKGTNEDQAVKVAVCFGIFDDDPENNGHKDILSLIEQTYERYARNPILDRNYRCDSEFEWGLQDENTSPYYFGAIAMTFRFTGLKVESKYI
jgi:hypothetical protein